ncbi:hypothetical protein EMIT019CA3_10287 [Bacillus pseudomycoides]
MLFFLGKYKNNLFWSRLERLRSAVSSILIDEYSCLYRV